MADVEDGDTTLDCPDAFPSHRGHLMSEKKKIESIKINALQKCAKVVRFLLLSLENLRNDEFRIRHLSN